MNTLEEEGITILEVVDASFCTNNTYVYNPSFENFHQICRFCLGYNNIKPIFNMTYKQVSVQNIIFDCLSLKVEANDFLPQHVCANCLAELIKYYNFREKCLETENILIAISNKKECKENKEQDITHKQDTIDIINKSNSINQSIDVLFNCENQNSITDDGGTIYKKDEQFEDIAVGDSGNFSDSTNESDTKSEKKAKMKRSTIKGRRPQGPPFKCKDCFQSFNTREDLKQHRKMAKHPEARNHTCSICDKSFTRSKLKQHMRVHTKEKPFVCKICSQAFSMSGNLKRHMMTHTGERPHVCEICGKGFIQATTLHIHRKTHMPTQYDCLESKCSTQHITCEICGRGFKRIARYRAHLVRHFPDEDDKPKEIKPRPKDTTTVREYTCSICKRAYKTKHLLKAHQLTHGEKSYLCSECGKGFITKAALQSHLKVHTGEKPHTCTVCKKSFAHVGSFEAHMLIHTGRKPYNCKVCSKAFTQLSHLKYHSRTHSGERPYSCNFCGKKFALKGNLTVHVRIHTGETPYLCPVCSKGFYDSSSMKKHRKGHGHTTDAVAEIKEESQKYVSFNNATVK